MCGALSLPNIHAPSTGQQLTDGGAIFHRRRLEGHEYLKYLCYSMFMVSFWLIARQYLEQDVLHLESLNHLVARGMRGSSHVSHTLVKSIEGILALPDVCTRVVTYLSPLVSMLNSF